MSEELESCPFCGALPIDQVDSHAVEQHVRNRYKFSRQELLDGCAPMTAPTLAGEEMERARRLAARIIDEAERDAEAGKMADQAFWPESSVTVARALLSSPRVERARALEEAAKVAEKLADELTRLKGSRESMRVQIGSHLETCATIAAAIRSLSPTDGAPANLPKVRTP